MTTIRQMKQLEINAISRSIFNTALTLSLPDRKNIITPKTVENANTAGNISYTTVISIAYLALPDLSSSLGIIIYFLHRKYLACNAAKGLMWLVHKG